MGFSIFPHHFNWTHTLKGDQLESNVTNVFSLFDPDRYCTSCSKVDCPTHCWGCGGDHDHNSQIEPYCLACVIELETEDELDVSGFWSPPDGNVSPIKGTRRKRVSIDSIDDLLSPIEVGQRWMAESLWEYS